MLSPLAAGRVCQQFHMGDQPWQTQCCLSGWWCTHSLSVQSPPMLHTESLCCIRSRKVKSIAPWIYFELKDSHEWIVNLFKNKNRSMKITGAQCLGFKPGYTCSWSLSTINVKTVKQWIKFIIDMHANIPFQLKMPRCAANINELWNSHCPWQI